MVEAVVRLGVALGGIALVAVLGGCTSHTVSPTWSSASGSAPPPVAAESAPPFSEPAAYAFTMIRGCDETSPLGRYKVTVRSGAVESAERIGATVQASPSADVDLGPAAGQDGEEIDVPTLAELRAMAQTAADDGAQVTTTYAADGRPVKVVINVEDDPSAAECFTVADYAPVA
ncbi:hypothetical protein BJ973_005194 [Actinoplanes tereljensis]|uniref:Lipoprotein n=1 Tax=Paractinoplanes tereljensis TaxID=571912 RepID=A0A919NNW3_9ACTN|nr:hypothetical protein [Actinoplanes tereljensis]GIF21356.1 hypothetical protein Ate02nite_40860 [Actinoplanes tereljensis]